jgi:amino acid permease
MAAEAPLLTKDDLLGGMPARRASTLLFAMESRAASLALVDREASTRYMLQHPPEEREQEFLSSLASGRAGVLPVTIQELELYARDWHPLIPEDTKIRAALAHMLAQKYHFRVQDVPAMRIALGFNTPEVAQAYQTLYSAPLSSIYIQEAGFGERARWFTTGLSRSLENISPFWMAFLLTIPGAAGLLAMPIALSGLGLSTGIALLVIFGVINMFTSAALAEAVARSGTTRFGVGFLGQLAGEYLGSAGLALLSTIMALNNFFVLIVFYVGVAGTLQDATHLSGMIWAAVLFAVSYYFLTRRSINATVGTTLLIVLINLGITLVIPVLALPHVQAANLANLQMPFVGLPRDPGVWKMVSGVMLSSYFSHIIIAAYAPVVLRRDPSARSWIRGSVSAIFALMLIAIFWMITANGVISPDVLAKTTGTVLTPLAGEIGPVVYLLGSILVLLSLGLAAIQIGLVLYFSANELIPANTAWLKDRGRFFISILPVIAVFLISEWVLATGSSSYASMLGYVSGITLPLMGGIMPVLLLVSTRRKGDFVPGLAPRITGHPLIVGVLYLFFLAAILVYALFLWTDPIPRTVALLVALAMLVFTGLMFRQGLMQPRLVIELRRDQRGPESASFTITSAGKAKPALVCLSYPDGEQTMTAAEGAIPSFSSLQSFSIQFPSTPAPEVKFWVHRLTPEGGSVGIPVAVQLRPELSLVPMQFTNGVGSMPLNSHEHQIKIVLDPGS